MNKQESDALNQELSALGISFAAAWFLPATIRRNYSSESCPSDLWSLVGRLSESGAPIYLPSGETITFSDEAENSDEFLRRLLDRAGWLIVLGSEEPVCYEGEEIDFDSPLLVFERVIYVDDFFDGMDMARQWAQELAASARAKRLKGIG